MEDSILPEEIDGVEDLPAHPEQHPRRVEFVDIGEIVPVVLQVYALIKGRVSATAGEVVLGDVGSPLVPDEPQQTHLV